jgi:hypothetical protein
VTSELMDKQAPGLVCHDLLIEALAADVALPPRDSFQRKVKRAQKKHFVKNMQTVLFSKLYEQKVAVRPMTAASRQQARDSHPDMLSSAPVQAHTQFCRGAAAMETTGPPGDQWQAQAPRPRRHDVRVAARRRGRAHTHSFTYALETHPHFVSP